MTTKSPNTPRVPKKKSVKPTRKVTTTRTAKNATPTPVKK